ncbi:DUF1127 domain-containing protein [Oceanimonas sp. NS1]|uniref:YjiS-like domain-containing protein n=1 Tax=Oceanimonas doudoroffii TaxID=84158 RepID=A0A233RGZ6_9GAMM|nr:MULTISPECIES: DUF1127 domain-containing protein [Oceanimonas]MCT7656543.1 DUF1127 domain-containing protein [Oceanimonas sp. NS1]NHI00743.1 hypothetical protein [Oceanimonas sp. MB9]OXY82676.1 hypothetical protein B6S08_03940 [Oceanimonas doudoroffii]
MTTVRLPLRRAGQAQAHTAGLLATLETWLRRSRTRRELAELPAYLLKDIGLNEADRYQEISKPFWQR